MSQNYCTLKRFSRDNDTYETLDGDKQKFEIVQHEKHLLCMFRLDTLKVERVGIKTPKPSNNRVATHNLMVRRSKFIRKSMYYILKVVFPQLFYKLNIEVGMLFIERENRCTLTHSRY